MDAGVAGRGHPEVHQRRVEIYLDSCSVRGVLETIHPRVSDHLASEGDTLTLLAARVVTRDGTQLARGTSTLIHKPVILFVVDLSSTGGYPGFRVERMQREGSDDKPPFIEGDLFSSLFEGAQSTRAIAAQPDQDRIVVTLDRSYGQGTDQVQWQDRAVLKSVGGAYLLDDGQGLFHRTLHALGCWPHRPRSDYSPNRNGGRMARR